MRAHGWPLTGFAAAIHWEPVRFDWGLPLLGAIIICAVFATAVAFTIQLWAQQYTSPAHAAILFALEPLFTVITSYLVLSEHLTPRAWKGCGAGRWRDPDCRIAGRTGGAGGA